MAKRINLSMTKISNRYLYQENLSMIQLVIKPRTYVAHNLLAVDLQLHVQITWDDLHQKFQHAQYFTGDPLIHQPIVICFHTVFSINLRIPSPFR